MVEAIVAAMVGGALILAVGVLIGSSMTLGIAAVLAKAYDGVTKKILKGDPGPVGMPGPMGPPGRDYGETDDTDSTRSSY